MFRKLLTESGEQEAIDDGGGESSDSLAKMAEEPASELWVMKQIRDHHRRCSTRRIVRQWKYGLIFLAGVILSGQVLGAIALKYAAHDLIRNTVIEVLREKKLLSATGQPVGSFAKLDE